MSFSVITLQIACPLNQPECSVTVEPSDTVSDVVAKALKLTSPGEDLNPSQYGIFVSPQKAWLFPMSLMADCVRQIQVSGEKAKPVFEVCPKEPVPVPISCGNYDVDLLCDPLQKMKSVAQQAAKHFASKDKFFEWSEWSLWKGNERVPDDARCGELSRDKQTVLLMKREFPPVNGAPEKVFKKTIADAVAREPGREVPLFAELLIQNAESNVNTEGLFRKCGLQQAITDMCDKLDVNGFQSEDEMKETLLKLPPHDATGILKSYLGTLTMPLVPPAFHPWLQHAEANTNWTDKLCEYRRILSALPGPSHALMMRLAKCADAVVKSGKENKMTLSSLAVCLTTSIIGRNLQVPTVLDISQPPETGGALEMSAVCATLLSKHTFLYGAGDVENMGVCVEPVSGLEVGEEYVMEPCEQQGSIILHKQGSEERVTVPRSCWVSYHVMFLRMRRNVAPVAQRNLYGRYFMKLPTATFSPETRKWLDSQIESISDQTEVIRSETRKLSALLQQLDEDQGNDEEIMALVEQYRTTPSLNL